MAAKCVLQVSLLIARDGFARSAKKHHVIDRTLVKQNECLSKFYILPVAWRI